MISSFVISDFRGIRDLKVGQLNTVNLIVGDNNSGKTSILEALQLLRSPSEFSNIVKVARTRNNAILGGVLTVYENFSYMFPRSDGDLELGVSAINDGDLFECRIYGQQHRVLLDESEIKDRFFRKMVNGDLETDEFQGQLMYQIKDESGTVPIRFNSFTRISGTTIRWTKAINMVYVPPCNYLNSNVINQIIRNDEYKDICIKVLQLFDPDIFDMIILKSTLGNSTVEYLKHTKLGTMPLSTFGDGIKKVLMLANAIVQAKGGVLLIDEVETSIHKKYYDDIFRFLVKACKAFGVQLFVTTHSIEAVDGLLATQDYNEQSRMDDISVVTVKRVGDMSYSRVLTGREVAANREAFGFEVRL